MASRDPRDARRLTQFDRRDQERTNDWSYVVRKSSGQGAGARRWASLCSREEERSAPHHKSVLNAREHLETVRALATGHNNMIISSARLRGACGKVRLSSARIIINRDHVQRTSNWVRK